MKSTHRLLLKLISIIVVFIALIVISFGDKGEISKSKNSYNYTQGSLPEEDIDSVNKKFFKKGVADKTPQEELHYLSHLSQFKSFNLLTKNFSEIHDLILGNANCKEHPKLTMLCLESIYTKLKDLVDSDNSSLSRSPSLSISALNEVQVALCTGGSLKIPTVCSDLIIDLNEKSLSATQEILELSCAEKSKGCSALAHLKIKHGVIKETEAFNLFEKGCLAGEFYSCLDGAQQLKSLGKEGEAQLFFDKSCLLGNPNGCLEVINKNDVLPEIIEVAEKNLIHYCESQKNIESCNQLSSFYKSKKDFKRFFLVVRLQCEAGDSSACYDYIELLKEKNVNQANQFRKQICTWFLNFDIKIADELETIDGFSCTDDDLCLPNEKLKHFPGICTDFEHYSSI